MHRRELSWLLSWYRHSELEGALLLGRMVRQADDPAVIAALTRHCADEARHGWLWQQTLDRLALPTVRIFRSYQSFYAEAGAAPGTLAEVLALTHVFEQRVDREFSEQLREGRFPEEVNRTFRALLGDEALHLAWVARWLEARPDGQRLLSTYRAADEGVYGSLRPYWQRLWDVPGLGEELMAPSSVAWPS